MSNPSPALPATPAGLASELFLLREFWNAWNEFHGLAAQRDAGHRPKHPRAVLESAAQRMTDRARDLRNFYDPTTSRT
ncbi:MAG: hypothetical protein IT325_09825 [Anaerolineae bacterium]|nr:hypothetical protein [Anaerolineae bacterium]